MSARPMVTRVLQSKAPVEVLGYLLPHERALLVSELREMVRAESVRTLEGVIGEWWAGDGAAQTKGEQIALLADMIRAAFPQIDGEAA